MKALSIGVALAGFFFSSLVPAWAGIKTRGEWHVETSMQVPGMEMVIPGGSFNHCMDEGGVPYQKKPGEDCKMLSRKVAGDTVTWRMRCNGAEGNLEIRGSSTYSGETMQGTMEMKSDQGAMTMRMKGRRIGPCRK